MDKQVSGTNPLRGAEVRKIKRGEEIQAFQAAPQDDQQNVFFKDKKGDTYMAAGKKMDLKGVAPGSTIRFNDQDVTVTAVEPGPVSLDLEELVRELRWLSGEKQVARMQELAKQTGDARTSCRIALATRQTGVSSHVLPIALEQIRNADDAVEVARTATLLGAFGFVGPALEKGLQQSDTTLLVRFAQEVRALGYEVQMDFARSTAVQLQKLAP